MAWKNKLSLKERFERHYTPEPNSGCWLWTGVVAAGYGKLRRDSDPSKPLDGAHRVSYELFKGEIPDGHVVCHKCDVRNCVNPDHLFVGTYKDNMQDAARKGRMNWKSKDRKLPVGEQHHSAKLTTEDVIAIRQLPISGVEAAQRFGVRPITISRIRRGLIWRHVGGAT
jgi:hypothetical protein